jgi:urate oxidase
MENDKWCTLGEVSERIFSTAIESTWHYATPNADFNACYDKVYLETKPQTLNPCYDKVY